MRKTLSAVFLVLSLGVIVSSSAFAGSVAGTLLVTSTIVPSCTVSTTAVNFGSHDGSNFVYASGDVTVACPSGTPYHIALDAGQNYNGVLRRLGNGAGNFNYYGLYHDGYAWGDSDYDNTYPFPSVTDTGNGASQAHEVFGELLGAPGSSLPSGTYTDVVQVTVHY